MKRSLLLLLALLLIACQSEEESLLIGDGAQVWHLKASRNVNAGDTVSLGDFELKNALFHPAYNHEFLDFQEKGNLDMQLLTSHGKNQKESGKWSLEDGGQALRFHPKITDLQAGKEAVVWKIESLSADKLLVSHAFSSSATALFEYERAEAEVPGTQKVEGPLSEASPGAQEQGLIVSKISAADYQAKRLKLLQMHPDSMNLPYSFSQMAIGMVSEFTKDGQTITVYADRQGNSEVYYSNGTVYSGGAAIPSIRASAKVLGGESGRLWESMSSPQSQELPEEGKLRFYIVNNRNVGEVYIDISRAQSGHADFQRLYLHLQSLIEDYNTALASL